jgi:hypothetical protein
MALTITACASQGGPGRAAAPEVSHAPARSPEDRCESLRKTWQATFAKNTNVCQSPDDCGVFPSGGANGPSLCSGVVDRETALALRAIDDQYAGAGCIMPAYSCPTMAPPRCVSGHCQ